MAIGKTLIIKFQFPTNGKAHSDKRLKSFLRLPRWSKFQFPTNGKAHSDLQRLLRGRSSTKVSIPYEREGTFRRLRRETKRSRISVSIPYEREGTFRLSIFNSNTELHIEFQFPTNGKAHSDGTLAASAQHTDILFQFPTNGKAHSDFRRSVGTPFSQRVSIPYEREGTFRHSNESKNFRSNNHRFNSLRTGRHIQTWRCWAVW